MSKKIAIKRASKAFIELVYDGVAHVAELTGGYVNEDVNTGRIKYFDSYTLWAENDAATNVRAGSLTVKRRATVAERVAEIEEYLAAA